MFSEGHVLADGGAHFPGAVQAFTDALSRHVGVHHGVEESAVLLVDLDTFAAEGLGSLMTGRLLCRHSGRRGQPSEPRRSHGEGCLDVAAVGGCFDSVGSDEWQIAELSPSIRQPK